MRLPVDPILLAIKRYLVVLHSSFFYVPVLKANCDFANGINVYVLMILRFEKGNKLIRMLFCIAEQLRRKATVIFASR